MNENLFDNTDPFDDPLWKEAEKAARSKRRRQSKIFIGCPMWWLRWVLPLTRSAEQLAVAIYLYRQRVVQRSKRIKISNTGLEKDLGISRYTKYRTLAKLEEGGVLTTHREGRRAIEATLRR